jgi:hypothetical protein
MFKMIFLRKYETTSTTTEEWRLCEVTFDAQGREIYSTRIIYGAVMDEDQFFDDVDDIRGIYK